MTSFQNGGDPRREISPPDSDVEEERLAAEYQEHLQYEGGEDLEQVSSMSMAQQTDDIQGRLAAAAQPLDFSAPLEVKFASYDNYCALFHFILNSDGPVDLEPPSVRCPVICILPKAHILICPLVLLGMGCHRRIHLSVQLVLLLQIQSRAPGKQRGRDHNSPRGTKHMGLLQCS